MSELFVKCQAPAGPFECHERVHGKFAKQCGHCKRLTCKKCSHLGFVCMGDCSQYCCSWCGTLEMLRCDYCVGASPQQSECSE